MSIQLLWAATGPLLPQRSLLPQGPFWSCPVPGRKRGTTHPLLVLTDKGSRAIAKKNGLINQTQSTETLRPEWGPHQQTAPDTPTEGLHTTGVAGRAQNSTLSSQARC